MAAPIDDSMTEELLQNLKNIFNLFDEDGDGAVNKRELRGILRLWGKNFTEADVREIIDDVKLDANGLVTFTDFLEMVNGDAAENTEMCDEDLRQTFQLIDTEKRGLISADKLLTVLKKMDDSLTDTDIELLVKEADADGDGQINCDEFVALMRSQ